LDDTATACGSVGVEGLDLVADAHSLGHRPRAARDAQPDLVRLAVARRNRPVQRVDTEQVEAHLARLHAGAAQPLAHDLAREARTRERAGACIRDLPFADPAVD